MNNPFHRAAVKAFAALLDDIKWGETPAADVPIIKRHAIADFEKRLEAQARAFDACKTGTEISMATLAHEQQHALSKFIKRLKLDGDYLAAVTVFQEHMKPHFEIRLW